MPTHGDAHTQALQSVSASDADQSASGASHSARSGLSPPPGVVARMRRDLKLNKQAAKQLWDVLVWQAASSRPELQDAVTAYMKQGVEDALSSQQRTARGKSFRDFETGFVMSKGKQGSQTAAYIPVEDGTTSAEARATAIEAGVTTRIDEINQILERLQ